MKRSFILIFIFFIVTACTLENIDDNNRNPKSDYSEKNYVLATEDASTPDITRFFSFTIDDIDSEQVYDLINDNMLFTNSDPSSSSGHHFFKNNIFSMAKDKNGYSSTPGIFQLTLNTDDRVFINNEIFLGKENLFPTKKLAIINESEGYFYNESLGSQMIQRFNPTTMKLEETIDLRPHIESFRPDAKFEDEAGNNLVRTGTLAMDSKDGKLYVSIVFLEEASFNLISDTEEHFYLAVINRNDLSFEKIITYPYAKTVGFFVSENNPTSVSENGSLYFSSWGWNQFNEHTPSKVFRIESGENDFDTSWMIDIESLFGKDHIVQSMITFNNKLYLHISDAPYLFDTSEELTTKNNLKMYYYEFDPETPNQYSKLPIPSSNPSSRMNVFTVLDDKLFIAVPNAIEGNFNGVYSLDRSGNIQPELQIENKYRPMRLYKLEK